MTAPTRSTDTAEGVRATIAAYCQALDDGRTDDLVALFTADGSSTLPGMDPVVGTEALHALYQTVVPDGPQRHLVVNTLVTADRGDEVEAFSDLVFLKLLGGAWAVPLVGRYADVLRNVDGRWRFASRVLTFTMAGS